MLAASASAAVAEAAAAVAGSAGAVAAAAAAVAAAAAAVAVAAAAEPAAVQSAVLALELLAGRVGNPASCYKTFTSGASCEANGAGSIRTVADCSAAAAALGLPDTTADHISYGTPYCNIGDTGFTLVFNSRGPKSASCWGVTTICWINCHRAILPGGRPPPSPSPP